jgi:hypothetical protein
MLSSGTCAVLLLLLASCFFLSDRLSYSLTLKMKAVCSSETPANFYQTAWGHTPAGISLYGDRHENHKSNADCVREWCNGGNIRSGFQTVRNGDASAWQISVTSPYLASHVCRKNSFSFLKSTYFRFYQDFRNVRIFWELWSIQFHYLTHTQGAPPPYKPLP